MVSKRLQLGVLAFLEPLLACPLVLAEPDGREARGNEEREKRED